MKNCLNLICIFLALLLSATVACRSNRDMHTTPGNTATTDSNGTALDYYAGEGSSGLLTVGRHPNDAARIEITGAYTIRKIQLKMYQVQGTAPAEQVFDVRIYRHDNVLDAPGTMIGNPSDSIKAKTIPLAPTDIMITGLNSAVTPGTYWIVFHVSNYEAVHSADWEAALNNHVIPLSTSATNRGRSLTYAAEPAASNWSEFYDCQVIFKLYGDSPASKKAAGGGSASCSGICHGNID